jgi:hypothetical protein
MERCLSILDLLKILSVRFVNNRIAKLPLYYKVANRSDTCEIKSTIGGIHGKCKNN